MNSTHRAARLAQQEGQNPRCLQEKASIDDGRSTSRLTSAEARDFQVRLDAIRSDYSRMMEGRPVTYEERADVMRRIDLLETDLDRFR